MSLSESKQWIIIFWPLLNPFDPRTRRKSIGSKKISCPKNNIIHLCTYQYKIHIRSKNITHKSNYNILPIPVSLSQPCSLPLSALPLQSASHSSSPLCHNSSFGGLATCVHFSSDLIYCSHPHTSWVGWGGMVSSLIWIYLIGDDLSLILH